MVLDGRVAGTLKALQHTVPNLTGVVQVLKEEDLRPLVLGDSRRVECVCFVAGGDAQIVVRHFKLDSLKCVDRLLDSAEFLPDPLVLHQGEVSALELSWEGAAGDVAAYVRTQDDTKVPTAVDGRRGVKRK